MYYNSVWPGAYSFKGEIKLFIDWFKNQLEIISKMSNVELFILSITRYSTGIEQKNWWLDTYAPFFKKENRVIISREENRKIRRCIYYRS